MFRLTGRGEIDPYLQQRSGEVVTGGQQGHTHLTLRSCELQPGHYRAQQHLHI